MGSILNPKHFSEQLDQGIKRANAMLKTLSAKPVSAKATRECPPRPPVA